MNSQKNDGTRSAPTTVFRTNDLIKLAIAKSILESESIEYFVKGEQIQSLFGLGGIGSVNPVTGPAEMQVAEADVKTATEALSELLAKD